MAKKAKVKYTLKFLGTDIVFEDIKVAFMPDVPGQEARFWIEFEGTRPRLVTTRGFVFDDEQTKATIYRPEDDEFPNELHVADAQYVYTAYNVIRGKPTAKQFYYLDMYYAGQVRLTHSQHFFPDNFAHAQIEGYELIKETA